MPDPAPPALDALLDLAHTLPGARVEWLDQWKNPARPVGRKRWEVSFYAAGTSTLGRFVQYDDSLAEACERLLGNAEPRVRTLLADRARELGAQIDTDLKDAA